MITVAIVEDNATIREMVAEWLNGDPGFQCVCSCSTASQALIEIPKHTPDVVLMDIHLSGESGIACTEKLKELLPKMQVVMFTVYNDHELLLQAMRAGATGYLLKRSSRDDVLKAISEVHAGGAPMTWEMARMLVESYQKKPDKAKPDLEVLSDREMEILTLVSKGMSSKDVSRTLNISYFTVVNHLRHIYEKIHVHSRMEAVMKFQESNRLPAN